MAIAGKDSYRVCVYCQKCGKIAPIDEKNQDGYGNPVYRWHQPCQSCGVMAWATKFIGSVTPIGNNKK